MSDRLAIIQAEESIREIRKIIAEARPLVSLFKEMRKEADNFNKSLRSGKPREYADAMQNLTNISRQYASIQRQVSQEMERLSRIERNNAQAAELNARARRETAAAAREEGRARQQANREAEREARINQNSSSSFRQLQREMQQVRQKARDYQADIFNLGRRLREGSISQNEYNRRVGEFRRNATEASREAIRLQNEIRRITQSTIPSGQRNGALFGRVTDILKAFGIANVIDNIASSFFKLGKSAYDTAVKLETLRLAQLAVFKTSQEVGRQNEFLEGIAQRYGIELLSLTDAYTKFAASAQGTTLEGRKTQEIFDAVTKSSARLGVSTEDTSGILRALGQMMSKGKVQAEELRGQLGDRMAGAFRLFADGMGVSTSQLDAMLKKGEVLAEDVLPKFAAQLNKKYELGVGEEIETTQASLTRLTNAWTIFVDALENRTKLVSNSVSSMTAVIVGLLKEITPSEAITAIQNEQTELNKLGLLLKQNWTDTKKRKDLLDQIISINPYLLDGLDKEKATLEEISERLRQTNEQYIQKILLQRFEEEINEVLEEQAERVRIIAKAYTDNAVEINNLSTQQQKLIEDFMQGKMTIDDLRVSLSKTGLEVFKHEELLNNLNIAVNTNTITSKGYIGTLDRLGKQGNDLTNKYNEQLKIIQKLTSSNGNLLGVNTAMINSNYLLGGSYNYLAQQEELAARKRNQDYQKTIKTARELKQAFAAFDGYYFDATTAKNTGKRVGEWDIVGNRLVKRESQKNEEDPKKYTGAKLDGYQKDFLMIAQGQRDTEIAQLKKQRMDLLIGQEEYEKQYEQIIVRYGNKIQAYLTGKNAKEIQVEGAAYKKAVEAMEQFMKERYNIRSKRLDEENKLQVNDLDRQARQLENADYLTDSERLLKQIDIQSQSISVQTDYYDKQIELARTSAEDVISWERKKAEEIGKLEDERDKKTRSLAEAISKNWETQFSSDQSNNDISIEERRRLILADKRLSIEERSYKLSQLDHDQAIENNKLELIRLQVEKGRIQAQAAIRALRGENPDQTEAEKAEMLKLDAQAKALLNNIEQETSNKQNETKDRWKTVAEEGIEMLRGLGMNNLADTLGKQFDDLFEKIQNGALKMKDVAVLAASVMADALTSMVNSQKDHTIAAIDEQLKYSQETAEQELDFINKRLEAINSLGELTQEQQDERNKLEDEARGIKEQQQMREKLYETQKARAEQKAASNQALINGALGATQAIASLAPPYSYVMAALALGFGVAQSVSIMSKDPTPKYFKGREDGPAELAWTQEQGREIITDKSGNIKDLGSDNGAKMTWLEKGDKVITAPKTKNYISRLKQLKEVPQIGTNIFKKVAMNSLQSPAINLTINKSEDYSQKIIDGLAQKLISGFGKEIQRNTNPDIQKINGFLIEFNGSKIPVTRGTYDLKTGEETWYQ